jgi:predicted AAA+ superfamily ATPase
VKTPKLHFLDSGLLTTLRGYGVARIRWERGLLGALLEGFIFSELLKLSSVSRDQNEVAFVKVPLGSSSDEVAVTAVAAASARAD